MHKGVVDLGIEPDVKEILDIHNRTLQDHNEKIQELQIDNASIKEKISSIEGIVTRFETNYYQTSNSMLQTMSQLVVNTNNNNTEIINNKNNNRKDIALKILGVIGILIAGAFIGKGADVGSVVTSLF